MKLLNIILLLLSFKALSQDVSNNRLGERELETKEKSFIFFDDPVLATLERDLSNVESVLDDLLRENEHYNIPFAGAIIYPKWQYVAGPILQMDGGNDGTVFAINANKKIFKLKEDRFYTFPGTISKVSVGNKDNICALGPKNKIFKLKRNIGWQRISGKAKSISCGQDGTMVAIVASNKKDGPLVIRKKKKWKNFPGKLEQISVGAKDNIWGLKSSGSVWFYDGNKWERKPGEMDYISVAADGSVAAVGKNGGAYLWDGLNWVNVAGVKLVIISVIKNGKYWAITEDGSVWKSYATSK